MIPSFTASPVYDMTTGIYYTTGATAVIPTPAYELIPHRVFVGGFPASTTELELREHFEQFFTIKEVKVIRSADGISKGYGFITFDTDDEADTVRGMSPDKLEFKGRKLNLGPALRRMSQRYSTDYAIATPTGLVQSPTYGYTYSFPPQAPFVMVNAPQAYVYTPGSPVPQAMIYPVAAPTNLAQEQSAVSGINGAVASPDGSPTRPQTSVSNTEVVMPVAAKLPASSPATAASSSVSVVATAVPMQQPQTCIQYPVYLPPQAPPTPITPTVVTHPRGSPPNVYNSQITSLPSAQYFTSADGQGFQYQQTFYYNNAPMTGAGDATTMQLVYGNGSPAATSLYGGTDYTPPPTVQPHDSPPIAQGLFTPSPRHGVTPQMVYEDSASDIWSNVLKKEFDNIHQNRKRETQRKSIVFCEDAVNVRTTVKESQKDRGDSQSTISSTEEMCEGFKTDSSSGISSRLCRTRRNGSKRPPQRQRSGGRFVRATPRAVMSLNGQFQSMRVSSDHQKNSANEVLRTSATPPESPQF
ncbi:hypothetical protein DICVIV_00929 [Dictyocaulus viviparus]|uniref:RRM domain-containing protein n=1 Tax=Dictyocaulus viviparus TaxID=29172 RepID=A0A0D8Y7Q4_DICVI|nr:hypothetical protein DICVIV_00929 [Dictyocaulus viviparus]